LAGRPGEPIESLSASFTRKIDAAKPKAIAAESEARHTTAVLYVVGVSSWLAGRVSARNVTAPASIRQPAPLEYFRLTVARPTVGRWCEAAATGEASLRE